MRLPMINAREWKLVAPLLPPSGGPGKPRLDDRLMVSAFFYSAATRATLECLPAGYGNAASLRTRQRRWQDDGTLARLMKAGKPVIERMTIEYQNKIRAASFGDRQRSPADFFGHGVIPRLAHAQPRGRYAARQRP